MRCFIEIFNETKETAKTFGGALSDLVSLLVVHVFGDFFADVAYRIFLKENWNDLLIDDGDMFCMYGY
jgi:hypothetical protein